MQCRSGAAYALAEEDFGALSRALRLAGGDAEEARRRMSVLLDSSDPFERTKASPEWLTRPDVWNRLGAEAASAKPHARREAEPADGEIVRRWWYSHHGEDVEYEVTEYTTGKRTKRRGPPHEYVGYEKASAEMRMHRAQANGHAVAAGAAS